MDHYVHNTEKMQDDIYKTTDEIAEKYRR